MDPLVVNRAHWDALATVHGRDAYYDKDALVAGRDSLNEYEAAAVGDVTGLDVLHLQCHIGFDSISLARRGARVTGADFSPGSLAAAAELAARAGVEAEWVEANAMDLPAALHGRFDLVYATLGVLCWIGDLDAWMRSAASALRPGGRLVLVELHPLFLMVGSVEPLQLDFPYAFDGARTFDEPGSYADPEADVSATATVEYAHSLGEVVTAALGAGLRIEALAEHMDAARDGRGLLTPEADGRCRLRVNGEVLPLLYTLVARR
ncbi:methyltransferase domain-containing protein [Solirubrobacter sp. CPCC 204708]|uniref:Methyltransferase domain-containing protein n=1 Tax=Solirubrobacter deserti TaxID=2282478 RepID=A0ABT4RQD1_9ACTN|nr:methyltransferase domain-containing protein [Solirubrobacter deserti]MBE2319910.1 methyltransferase domain-containing protein [Solirubrobacter deserti]MDA0140496.1 methyltransferase domain-containing protein [Solirubrobacter deserti]